MNKKICITAAIGILISGVLVSTFNFDDNNNNTAKANSAQIRIETQQNNSLTPVTPTLISGNPKISVINEAPEVEIEKLFAQDEIPDEIFSVFVMKAMADYQLNILQVESFKLQSPIIQLTPERLEILSMALQRAKERKSYKNINLLAQILEKWQANDYSTLQKDRDNLKKIESLNVEAFAKLQSEKKKKNSVAKDEYILGIKKAVGEKKNLSQEHFKDTLGNWFSSSYSNLEPFKLSTAEKKLIAEKVYPANTLQTTADVLVELEKMYSDKDFYTYERYVALAYYLTSGQNKTDSYRFEEFPPLPYFPFDYDDKEISAYSLSDSYTKFHEFIYGLDR